MKTLVTFGQNHLHRIDDITFDADCVALVNGDREKVFEIFGEKWCFEYSEKEFDMDNLTYFPRGIIEVKG